MYRVELKVSSMVCVQMRGNKVPNVPCGVESITKRHSENRNIRVPNVPCGVESVITYKVRYNLFLVPNNMI